MIGDWDGVIGMLLLFYVGSPLAAWAGLVVARHDRRRGESVLTRPGVLAWLITATLACAELLTAGLLGVGIAAVILAFVHLPLAGLAWLFWVWVEWLGLPSVEWWQPGPVEWCVGLGVACDCGWMAFGA